VAAEARARDAARLYWTTKEGNTTARALYDRVATFSGFIRYDHATPEGVDQGVGGRVGRRATAQRP